METHVRFLSLSGREETVEAVEAARALVDTDTATLDGFGPLAVFDFNGDGTFDFDDFHALAEEFSDFS